MNTIRGYFSQYFTNLFKNYQKYFTHPENLDNWDLKDVFNHELFIENDNSGTDFFKDFFFTRTWTIFIEGLIIPETVEEVQVHKHFDECIKNLDKENIFSCVNTFKDSFEEKEEFSFLFHPEKYFGKNASMKNLYLDGVDNNGIKIEYCVETIEIQE